MSCSCNQNPCCCQSACSEANVIYQGTCADPGSLTSLRHLLGLDASFCQRRLLPGTGGYLVARQTPNGWLIGFSTTPAIALEEFLAVQGVTFGRVLVQQSDNVMRVMNAPLVANLVLGTNAAGQQMWIPIPTATVPDPLTVADLTVTNLATLNDVSIAGGVNFLGLGTGTLVFTLGVDGSGNLIQGTPATTGVQCCMFYESATSPGPTDPNQDAAAGDLLVIGNLIFDSVLPAVPGGALISVTNSQALAVITDGLYEIIWGGEISYGGGNSGKPSINLLINGLNVNTGFSRPDFTDGLSVQDTIAVSGVEQRRMVAGTTIQLRLDSGSGSGTHVYEVRLGAKRLGA